MVTRVKLFSYLLYCFFSQYSYSTGLGDLGSGAGQGGGDGGSVRQAGGSFGKREAGLEGEYFNRLVSFSFLFNGVDVF